MARTYYNSTNPSYTKATEIQVAKPFDTRVVADTLADLLVITAAGYKYAYTGMVVYVVSEGCQYVYTGTSGKATDIKNSAKWVKLGGSDFNAEDYRSYYAEQLGARFVSSVDELDDLTFKFDGMFAVVTGSSESESEDGLYVLQDSTTNTWLKIMGSTGGSSSTDTSSVINTDTNEAPTSGSGISISTNDSTDVEEVYVDDSNGFAAGTYYTSRGLNADLTNDGTDSDQTLGDVDYIILTNGGNSYIRLYSKSNTNWIYIHKEDDTLGLGTVKYLDENDVEQTWDESESKNLELTMEQEITCSNDVDFTGWKETRITLNPYTSSDYVFGSTGSRYYDLDIYTVNVLPKVYAYSNGTQVQVLTTVDKEEILNTITETVEPDTISEPDILALFNEDSD